MFHARTDDDVGEKEEGSKDAEDDDGNDDALFDRRAGSKADDCGVATCLGDVASG